MFLFLCVKFMCYKLYVWWMGGRDGLEHGDFFNASDLSSKVFLGIFPPFEKPMEEKKLIAAKALKVRSWSSNSSGTSEDVKLLSTTASRRQDFCSAMFVLYQSCSLVSRWEILGAVLKNSWRISMNLSAKSHLRLYLCVSVWMVFGFSCLQVHERGGEKCFRHRIGIHCGICQENDGRCSVCTPHLLSTLAASSFCYNVSLMGRWIAKVPDCIFLKRFFHVL